jgi:hypothetical protein
MSTPVTPGINPPPTTYPIPAPGDGVTSANTLQYVQPIVDAIGWLQSKVPGANPVGSPIALWQHVANSSLVVSSSNWAKTYLDFTIGTPVVHQISSGSEKFMIPLNLVPGTVIDSMNLYCIGSWTLVSGTTHGANLPVTMPLLELFKLNWNTALGGNSLTGSVVDSQSDTSASVVAYEEIHFIGKNLVTPEVVSPLCQYFLRVTGEQGTHYQNGFSVLAGNVLVSSS